MTTQPLRDAFDRDIVIAPSPFFDRGLFYAATLNGNSTTTINPFVDPDATGKVLPAGMPPLATAAPAPTAPPCYLFFSLPPFGLPAGANGGLVYLSNGIVANTPDGQNLLSVSIDIVNANAQQVTVLFQIFSVRPFGT